MDALSRYISNGAMRERLQYSLEHHAVLAVYTKSIDGKLFEWNDVLTDFIKPGDVPYKKIYNLRNCARAAFQRAEHNQLPEGKIL